MSVYKDQLNSFVSTLEVKAKVVFDWGGSQNPIKGRTRSWDVQDYKIVDLAEPHVEKQKPDFVWDANENHWPDEDMNKYMGNVDALFMFGVFDYVIEPGQAMRNVASLLSPSGYAWIEFPLFYGHHEPLWAEGCRYSEGCIMRLLDRADLKLDEIIRKPAGNPLLVEFMRLDGQRLSKNYQYHDTVGFITKVSRNAD